MSPCLQLPPMTVARRLQVAEFLIRYKPPEYVAKIEQQDEIIKAKQRAKPSRQTRLHPCRYDDYLTQN
jgi:hypothetical protein